MEMADTVIVIAAGDSIKYQLFITQPPATGLAALEHLKYNCIILWPL